MALESLKLELELFVCSDCHSWKAFLHTANWSIQTPWLPTNYFLFYTVRSESALHCICICCQLNPVLITRSSVLEVSLVDIPTTLKIFLPTYGIRIFLILEEIRQFHTELKIKLLILIAACSAIITWVNREPHSRLHPAHVAGVLQIVGP